MTILPLIAILLAEDAGQAQALRDIQASHIDANVPASTDFEPFLRRDLSAYFSKDRHLRNVKVEYEFLRDGPTQSGVSYPKYYIWVRINGGKSSEDRGAARVTAVERKGFEVTMFASEREIRTNVGALKLVFPRPVCEKIEAKLGTPK
jgi:hypothetical protein